MTPGIAPTQDRIEGSARLRTILLTWPAIVVLGLVIGGIYGGIFTPTEAAAVGTIAMLLIGILQRAAGLCRDQGRDRGLAQTSAMIFIILLGAEVFDAFLALSQLPVKAAQMVGDPGLPPYAIMALLMLFYVVLGAVMDELAMILLTLPVFFPVVQALDFGMPADDVGIWFGILVLMVVGVGLVAPPIGLNVFVVSAIAKDVPIQSTYRGVLPFVAADIVRIGLLIAFPGLALWLVITCCMNPSIARTSCGVRSSWMQDAAILLKVAGFISSGGPSWPRLLDRARQHHQPRALQGLCCRQRGRIRHIQGPLPGA
jgi:TRAP-type C4-dicarboxylate transport system permease large subunit